MPGYEIDPNTMDIALDGDGKPAVTTSPAPELLLAMGVSRGTVIGDPELGSRVPDIVRTDAPSIAEVEAAAVDGVARLERAGTVVVEGVAFSRLAGLVVTTTGLTFTVPIGDI